MSVKTNSDFRDLLAALNAAGAEYPQPVSVISRKHLIQNKKAAGRPQDVADVDALEKLDEE